MQQSSLKEVFLQSFDTYGDAIFRFCVVKTSNPELAQDLTQETFMKYWQSLQKGTQMSNTRSFLYTIANNMIIDWYRKKKATSLDALHDQGFEASETHTLSAESESAYKEVLAVIGDLEEKDREVLLLRFVEGFEPKDIAEMLGETANVVSVRINRALHKVQQKLNV